MNQKTGAHFTELLGHTNLLSEKRLLGKKGYWPKLDVIATEPKQQLNTYPKYIIWSFGW